MSFINVFTYLSRCPTFTLFAFDTFPTNLLKKNVYKKIKFVKKINSVNT